jgi:hypothetical protein
MNHCILGLFLFCIANFGVAFVFKFQTLQRTSTKTAISRVFSNRWAAPEQSKSNAPKQSKETEKQPGFSYTVEMSKFAGIDWGSDLSFRWVYVVGLDPEGEAAKSKLIEKGDYIVGFGNTSVIAQDFDTVLNVRIRSIKRKIVVFLFKQQLILLWHFSNFRLSRINLHN